MKVPSRATQWHDAAVESAVVATHTELQTHFVSPVQCSLCTLHNYTVSKALGHGYRPARQEMSLLASPRQEAQQKVGELAWWHDALHLLSGSARLSPMKPGFHRREEHPWQSPRTMDFAPSPNCTCRVGGSTVNAQGNTNKHE